MFRLLSVILGAAMPMMSLAAPAAENEAEATIGIPDKCAQRVRLRSYDPIYAVYQRTQDDERA